MGGRYSVKGKTGHGRKARSTCKDIRDVPAVCESWVRSARWLAASACRTTAMRIRRESGKMGQRMMLAAWNGLAGGNRKMCCLLLKVGRRGMERFVISKRKRAERN